MVGIESSVGSYPETWTMVDMLTETEKNELAKCSNEVGGCSFPIQHSETESEDDGTIAISNAHITVDLRAGPPELTSPHTKTIIINVGEAAHTAAIVLVGIFDDGVSENYPLPAVAPIMIIRDPPGGGSYAYYENVKTTTFIQQEQKEPVSYTHLTLPTILLV